MPPLIDDLEMKFKEADATDDITVHLDFQAKLLASQDPKVVDYHFNLLKRASNKKLIHGTLTHSFERRGEDGRDYLLNRISSETDPFLIAKSLQILGKTGYRQAPGLARGYMTHSDALVREWACIVLGWVGTEPDIEILGRLQIEEKDSNTRKWAATQQMHIWFRYPNVKDAVISNLLAAIENEANPEVLEMIIYTAQQLLKRRFGLKSDPESPRGRMLGDLNEARRRTAVALKNYLQKTQHNKCIM